MSVEKIRSIIVKFLDEHEATICHEDMSSEILKQAMAKALAEKLVENGVTITSIGMGKKNDGERKA
jgi:hypothetical protein